MATVPKRDVIILLPGGLAATFDLAAFLVTMIAPVKKSVNQLKTILMISKLLIKYELENFSLIE